MPEPRNPQTLNRYAYTRNNPLRYTDPTGHFTESAIAEYYEVDSVEHIWWWDNPDYADWQNMLLTAEGGDVLIGATGFYGFDGDGQDVFRGVYISDEYGNGDKSRKLDINYITADATSKVGTPAWYGFIRWREGTPSFYVRDGYYWEQIVTPEAIRWGIGFAFEIPAIGLLARMGDIPLRKLLPMEALASGSGAFMANWFLDVNHMQQNDVTVLIYPCANGTGPTCIANVLDMRWRWDAKRGWYLR